MNKPTYEELEKRLKFLEQENQELKQLNNRLHSIIECSPDAIVITDTKGNIEYTNPMFTEVTGYSSEEIKGENPKILQSGFHKTCYYQNLWRTILAGKIWRGEFLNKRKNGELFWEMANIAPIKNEAGEIINFVAIKPEITRSKNTEIQLKKSEALFRSVFYDSGVGMAMTINRGRFINVNNEFCQIVGYTKDELLNLNVYDITHPQDKEKEQELVKKLLCREEKSLKYEKRFIHKDKHEVWVAIALTFLLDIDGNSVCGVGQVYDITERKNYELQLKELNATKDKFFSIIAHDLKNPFSNILGFSDLLYKKFDQLDTEKQKQQIKYIKHSAKNAYQLLENLLEWSRSQTNRIKFEPKNFDLKTNLNEVIFSLEEMAIKKEISLHVQIDYPITIFADQNMLNTILRNLITNAIKFTYRKGTVLIQAQQTQTDVCISVTDNGTGIEEDKIDQLFRIDSKYTTEGTENEASTGLGLILCKEFVERHHGKIEVESTLQKGSTFKFTLPQKDRLKTN